jgi:protein-tyrosine-phosphatase/predicted ATP-grasp superfamily ATP-dependent carboligase
MSGSPRKALVLSDDPRPLLGVVRSLGRGGVQVHVGWYPPDRFALSSRYIHRVHALPAYAPDNAAWKDALIALMERERFDLVVPCTDSTLIPLQQHRHELEPFGRIYLLSDAAFAILFDKFRTNALARAAGVRLPREVVLNSRQEFEQIEDSFPLPAVLKPRASFEVADLGTRHSVRKAYSQAEFRQLAAAMLDLGPVAVQENFIGEGVGVELLLQTGAPLMAFQHVRVHEPLHGGGSSYRQSVAVSPDLLEAALKILRPLEYTGVAMAEFKVNPRTKEWVFIEINGRFWGSLPLAVAAGADFPLALFQLLVEGRTRFPNSYRRNVYCRSWYSDFAWQRANLRADRSDPTLASRPLPRVLFDIVVNTLTFRERSDMFTLDDPRPGVGEIRLIGAKVRQELAGTLTRRRLQSPAARRRSSERAHGAVSSARTILFVCKGNICRSPFAEAYLRSRTASRMNVLSAGYYPHAGRPSPGHAQAVAASFGVDLATHRSQVLTEQIVRPAQVIFVFDFENHQRVTADYPEARDRIHFLGALNPEGPLFIDDPWGADAGAFHAVYAQIVAALHAAFGVVDEPRPSEDTSTLSAALRGA